MTQEFIAPRKAGRLDSFLSEQTGISRSKIQKYIENSLVSVNSLICNTPSKKLTENDIIFLTVPEEHNSLHAAENNLTIYYQDEHIAVIEKKAGLTVHPCPSCQEETLVHHLLYHFPSLAKMDSERPGIVHRLDKDTSGLMLIALNEESRLKLTEAFSEREVQKTYLALVQGICPNGESHESIGRHPTVKTKMAVVPINKGGREAFSEWERIYPDTASLSEQTIENSKQADNFSLVKVRIHTGRTHQIRVHLTAFGHPLLGDEVYAPVQTALKASRQMLHAYHLSFYHPFNGEFMKFTSLPPIDFWQCMENQLSQKQKAVQLIITGNSGCGKSALINFAARQNFPTFSADQCIQELYQVNNDAWYLLKQQYGTRFVPHETMPVDKTALAEAMQNETMKQELESILHPLVYNRMIKFFNDNSHASIAIAEIPLWFESKPTKLSFKPLTLCVSCEEAIRKKRLYERSWNDKIIAFMDSWQLPQSEKLRLADYILSNNGSLEVLEQQFLAVLNNLIKNNKSETAVIIHQIKNKLL